MKTWNLDFVVHGERHQVKLGRGITRSVAQELATVKRGQILKGELGIGMKRKKDLSLSDASRKFLDWAKTNKKSNTYRIYTACLAQLDNEFSGKLLVEITPWSLEGYKKKRGEGRQRRAASLESEPEGNSIR